MRNSKKIKIIAEAAQGFEGDPLLARLLVRAAGRAGADAVKFQLFSPRDLYGFGSDVSSLPREWIPKMAEKAQACGIARATHVILSHGFPLRAALAV
jgi:hypothetical protein